MAGHLKMNTSHGYHPLAFHHFCPKTVISPFLHSEAVVSSSHHPKAVFQLLLRWGPFSTSLLQLLHSGTCITDCPGCSRKMAAICGFWNAFSQDRLVVDLSGLLLQGPKLSCSTEAVMTSSYQFSLSIPNSGMVHLAVST